MDSNQSINCLSYHSNTDKSFHEMFMEEMLGNQSISENFQHI
jgi:hypothetical protein